MAELYYLDNGNPVKIPIGSGGGGGNVVTKLVSSSRESVITKGTSFTVPEYSVGSGNLQVFYDGLLCLEGEDAQYVETSSTSITFNDDIATDVEIIVLVL